MNKSLIIIVGLVALAAMLDSANAAECKKDEWECKDGKQCVPMSKLCNGPKDCQDKSDEDEKVCEKVECKPDEHRCKKKMGGRLCVPNDKKCDATYDCWDTTDETEETCNAHKCREDQFRCPNRKIGKLCLNKNQLCDGRKDCYDSDADEGDKLCGKPEL